MAMHDAALPAGASFLEQTLARGGSQVEWHVAFRVDNGASRRLVPRSLDGGHGLRCVRREEPLSGAMVASSAGLSKFMRILTLKIAWRFDRGDDFCSVYMRYSLSFC
jgi:hypothetical protein